MRRLLFPSLLFFTLLWGNCVSAAQAVQAPEVLLKQLTTEMITALRSHDAELKRNPSMVYKIIDNILVPHIDWEGMAQWVVKRSVWDEAAQEDRKEFVMEFRRLLIRTYGNTLRAYNNQTIQYLPAHQDASGRVQVASLIKEPNREPVRVAYRLVNRGSGWKVYDISIEGVSLLQGFHSQFAPYQSGGMQTLIARLQKHNARKI